MGRSYLAVMATTALSTSSTDTLPPVRVHLLAWGLTEQHVDKAVRTAQGRPARRAWDFAEVERSTDDACPINVCDPKVIAADCGSGWAYAVYAAGDG